MPFLNPGARRRRLAAKAPRGPLRALLEAPLPGTGTPCREVRFVALDLETTGLEAGRDEILSMGWVQIEALRIDLSTARRRLVRPSRAIPEQTAVIHRIMDDHAAGGAPMDQVLPELLGALAGKVLIAHHAPLELSFLEAACRRVYGQGLLIPAVDTLQLARERMERRQLAYRKGDLRLDALRAGYNLPRYRAHDALSDALAAAELFLAELAERDTRGMTPLKRVLTNW